jgi:hypothetical protein
MALGGSNAKADQGRGHRSGICCLSYASNVGHADSGSGETGSSRNGVTEQLFTGEHRHTVNSGRRCIGAKSVGPTGRRDVAQTGIQDR